MRDGDRVTAATLPEAFARRYVRAASSGSPTISRSPRSSFAHGAAGIAYFLLRHAAIAGGAGSLDAARAWAASTQRGLDEPGALVGAPPVFPGERAAVPASLYFGNAGVWCVGALVANARGDHAEAMRCLDHYVKAAADVDRADVASGAAGLLLGAAALVEAWPTAPEPLVRLGTGLEQQLASFTGDWLGAAHGHAGVVHARLRWCQAISGVPPDDLRSKLIGLAGAQLPSGLWPRRPGSDEIWPGWCHGSAGWVLLWALAASVLNEPVASVLVDRVMAHALADDAAGAGLCCGQAGAASRRAGVASGHRRWRLVNARSRRCRRASALRRRAQSFRPTASGAAISVLRCSPLSSKRRNGRRCRSTNALRRHAVPPFRRTVSQNVTPESRFD